MSSYSRRSKAGINLRREARGALAIFEALERSGRSLLDVQGGEALIVAVPEEHKKKKKEKPRTPEGTGIRLAGDEVFVQYRDRIRERNSEAGDSGNGELVFPTTLFNPDTSVSPDVPFQMDPDGRKAHARHDAELGLPVRGEVPMRLVTSHVELSGTGQHVVRLEVRTTARKEG